MTAGGTHTGRMALDTVVALLLGGLLLFAGWLAWYQPGAERGAHAPAAQEGMAEPLAIDGRQMRVVIGRGVVRGEALAITGYEFHAINHNAVAVYRGSLQAAEFPYLEYALQTRFPGPAVNVTWRTASDPRTLHSQSLNTRADQLAVLRLQGLKGWEGTIIEVGVHVITFDPDSVGPVRIEQLEFLPPDWRLALASQVSAWTAFRGWGASSINYLRGKNAENGVSVLPVIAAWAVLSICVLAGIGVLRGRRTPVAYALVLLVAWITADLLWQRELNAQLEVSRATFANKSMQERHEADIDAWVYRYIRRLKADYLPTQPARVVIIHDALKHHYDRLKAQYYLLPHNVYNFKSGLENGAYRRGDYILVLRDATNPVLNEKTHQLVWRDGLRVPVRVVYDEIRGVLYQVLAPPAASGPASS